MRITRDAADAEEVTQDVFIKIYRKLRHFGFRSSFKTWAYRIFAVKEILTPEQFAKFNESMEKKKGGRKGRGRGKCEHGAD